MFPGSGAASDTDTIRYGPINQISEIIFDKKSDYSFKEALLPISQTLFFFTETETKEAAPPEKGIVIFLRACDLAAVKRLDAIYLLNGCEDYYYKRIRENTYFVLMPCQTSFDTCFCVDMHTNTADNFDAFVEKQDDVFIFDCPNDKLIYILQNVLPQNSALKKDVTPSFVKENSTRARIANITDSAKIIGSPLWDEYDGRCINCGRCNCVCPTCTCWTMQDIFYNENGRAGERRRVWASCMVAGFTDVAGGGAYRKKNGARMRFKVLHKILDFKERFGYLMCVGCGRCDSVCPEYISFSNTKNKLNNDAGVKK
jgi:anaerobic sulfite reductase subunit A